MESKMTECSDSYKQASSEGTGVEEKREKRRRRIYAATMQGL
jgi:hypothetical protein